MLTIRIDAGLAGEEGRRDLTEEARRQSLLVSRRSEREALELIEQVADTRDWK